MKSHNLVLPIKRVYETVSYQSSKEDLLGVVFFDQQTLKNALFYYQLEKQPVFGSHSLTLEMIICLYFITQALHKLLISKNKNVLF